MRVLRLLLSYGPITVFVIAVAYSCGEQSRVNAPLQNPEAVVWGEGESRIVFSVEETSDGEISTHHIKALAADDRVVFEESWDVNHDMFGGGFVKGAQLDDDDELEILAWGAHEADRAFFLDHSEGTVVRRPFSEASSPAQALPGQWRQAHTGNGLTLFLLGGLVFIYYVVYGIFRLVARHTTPKRNEPEKKIARWPVYISVLSMVAIYLTLPIDIPTAWMFFVVLAVLMWKKKYRAAVVYTLVSPLMVSTTSATFGYFNGSAKLSSSRTKWVEAHNVDPDLRCSRHNSGEWRGRNDWILSIPNNAVLRVLIGILGPMEGSYLGPYPDREEALAALNEAEPISMNDLVNDRVRVAGRQLKLDSRVGRELSRDLFNGTDDEWQELLATDRPYGAAASLYQVECLILMIPQNPQLLETENKDPNLLTALAANGETVGFASARIVLIDVAGGRPFAYYGSGTYSHRSPPVRWSPLD